MKLISAQNISLENNNTNGRYVKLCDLGLAVNHKLQSMSHTSRVGSPGYVAPEVAQGRTYNTKADVFSVGMIASDLFREDIIL